MELCFFCSMTNLIRYPASFFFFNDTATTEIYTLSLHDALPISAETPNGRETATAPARREVCSAWSARRPGARKNDPTATWRRPSRRQWRTASAGDGEA